MLRNSRVIIVGCSYSAIVVTWFMQKYPHLAHGAWASSAPLNVKVDFPEYFEVVAMAIEKVGGEECARRVRVAISQLEQWVEEKNSDAIEENMLLCNKVDFDNVYDVENMFMYFTVPWAFLVQNHREQYQTIQSQCELLNSMDTGDEVFNYAYWFWYDDFLQERYNVCLDHLFERDVMYVNETSWDSAGVRDEWRQWFYQTCSEVGFYTTAVNNTLFGSSFTVDISYKLCELAFGENFLRNRVDANVERTKIIYGALNPAVNRVYSVHGEIDPWAAMGVRKDINQYSPTTICPMEAHCSDLGSISELDLEETRRSKEKIFELVKQWLNLNKSATQPSEKRLTRETQSII